MLSVKRMRSLSWTMLRIINLTLSTHQSNLGEKILLLTACNNYGIQVNLSETKAPIWTNIASCISANVQAEHSCLQPIEMVWAIVKSEVGRQYTDMTSFQDVNSRLQLVFTNLTSKAIYVCTAKSIAKLMEMKSFIDALETIPVVELSSSLSSNGLSDSAEENIWHL
ncbi:hypothetical protein THRCLA_21103 [Thraustotheca clavata]|uniref:Tc1-like transposase DDE domain-containing protein n=1 Tax=Thraustotheca clavata TaxID=74557 RepID=A0A1W0A098_9STRA|nr:hypothetical protein THRCLA_21103 [Thraustotheca clavata]